jgi:hypothetical protein
MLDKETLTKAFRDYEDYLVHFIRNDRNYGHYSRKVVLERVRNTLIDAIVESNKENKDA